MGVLDGCGLELDEIRAATSQELFEAALRWLGQISVNPNSHSSVAKQAAVDILLELKSRG